MFKDKWTWITGAIVVMLAVGVVVGLTFSKPGSTATNSTATSANTIARATFRNPSFGQTGARVVVDTVTLLPAARAFSGPDSLSLYQIVGSPVTAEVMQSLADKLGLASVGRSIQGPAVTDGTWRLMFPRADDFQSFRVEQPDAVPQYCEKLDQGADLRAPSPEEARAAADAYLKSIGMEAGLRYVTYHVNSYKRSGGGLPEIAADVAVVVVYETSIDGLSLVGPGAKIDVTVGPEGQVIAFGRLAETSKPTGQAIALRDVAKALTDLKDGKGQVPTRFSDDDFKTVEVQSVRLAYYAAPVPMGEKYYRPVYDFQVKGANGETGDWLVSAYEGDVNGL